MEKFKELLSSLKQDLCEPEGRKICFFSLFKSILVIILFSLFFYRNIFISFLLIPIGMFIFITSYERAKEKEKKEIAEQFCEALLSIEGSLKAGYSLENAFLESEKDINIIYGPKSMISKELEKIKTGLNLNIPIDILLLEFSKKYDVFEIREFTKTCQIIKTNGGNIAKVIGGIVALNSSREATENEVNTLLDGRLFEGRIMQAMPFALIAYIEICYKGYFDTLYETFKGKMIMTLCLLLYMLALLIYNKTIDYIKKER